MTRRSHSRNQSTEAHISAPRFTSVAELVRERAEITPEAPGFFYRDAAGSWNAKSWREVHSEVERFREELNRHGVSRGCSVGVLLATSVAWEIVNLACLADGATVVGLDPHDSGESLTRAAEVAAIEALVVSADTWSELDSDVVAGLRIVFVLDAGALESSATISRVHRGSGGSVTRSLSHADATVIFTSGSTGRPKAIAYSEAQLLLACQEILAAFPEIGPATRTVCWLPLSNLFQRMVNLCAVATGARVYFVREPRKLMDYLPEIRPHVLIGVPRFYEKVYEELNRALARLPLGLKQAVDRLFEHARGAPSLKRQLARRTLRLLLRPIRRAFGGSIQFMISGSAPMPLWLLERYEALGLLVLEAYGLSENVVPISCNRFRNFKLGSVGLPMSSNTLRLSDDGELLCAGPGVCRRYISAGDELSVNDEGFLATGDYARFDDDGFLWLTGRKSDVFKTSTGRRISPVEVEACISEAAEVEHVVVIGENRKFLLALAMLGPDATDAAASRAQRAMARAISGLASYKRPAAALFVSGSFSVAAGELTTNLKLRRRAIAARYQSQLDAVVEKLERGELPKSGVARINERSFAGRL